jgi:hypothetical protein
MNSRLSAWAPSQFYWRTEQEPNCREDLEAGKQELGHGKQRRLKAQYLWIFPSQIPFQKAPSQHPTVTSKTPVCHVVTRQLLPKTQACHIVTRRSLPHHHSAITLNMAGAARSNSAVISKTLMSCSVFRSALISKTPTSSSSHSALPLKEFRRRVQSLGSYL